MANMSHLNKKQLNNVSEVDYLCVDHFVKSFVEARALLTAFEMHLIDVLSDDHPISFDSLERQLNSNATGLRLLLDLLLANDVIEENSGGVKLTRQFTHAMQYRDLLKAKLDFANVAAHDIIDFFSLLINNPNEFMHRANMFKLFSYDKSIDYNPKNYALTKGWMRITSSLTKYEAGVCMKHHGFGKYKRMLDIGGNSGEFVLQICKKNPKIHATVFDLPLVCDVGKEHILHKPEADRISFIKGNALADNLPLGFDIITFKSILHDWPDKEAKQFIDRAIPSLEPGGTLLIFERGPLEIGKTLFPYSMIPFLLFSHFFRLPALYCEHLKDQGFLDIKVQKFELETPFFLISAVKKI